MTEELCIECKTFDEIVPALAKHLGEKDHELGQADSVMKLKLGWHIVSKNVTVSISMSNLRKSMEKMKLGRRELLASALESSEGRKNLSNALLSMAKAFKAK